MNKKELVNAVSKVADARKVDAEAALDALAVVVKDELAKTGSITLPGIGHLTVKETAERQGRNPSTGEVITIPAKNRIKLTAVKALKSAVN